MTSIQLICKGGRARVTVDGPLNEGMRHVPVQITFDTAWDGLVPTLAAMGEKKYPMVVNAAGESEIPADALVAGLPLKLGVTGKSADGKTVLPTYWVDCGKVNASPEGEPDAEPGEDPDPTVVEQIQALAYGADQKADDAQEKAAEAKEAAQEAEQEAEEALEKAQTAEQIAKGAARAYVAETYAALDAWLREPGNAGKLQRGDNLYIVDKDVPDYWVVATLAAADPETGYWYRIAELETGKVDLDGYAKLEQLAPVALSGRYQDLAGKPEIPAAYDDTEIRRKIQGLEEDSVEIKGGLTQVEQLLPEAAPAVGKVLKVLSVIPDGTFTCEWADAPSGGGNVPNDAERIPDNVVLFEQDDSNDDEQLVESLLLNKLALESDGEYIYLKFGGIELGKVESASGASTVYCTGIEINQNDLNLSISDSTTHYLTASVSPVDCTQAIRWSSSNIEAVQVSQLGELTIVGEGVATIVARCGSYSDSIEVAVVDDELHYEIVTGGMILSNGTDAFREARKDRCTLKPLLLYVGYDSTIKITVADSGFYFGVAGWNIPGSTDDLENNGRVTTSGRILDSGWKSGTYTATSTGWTHLGLAFRYGGGSAFTEEAIARLAAALTIEVM